MFATTDIYLGLVLDFLTDFVIKIKYTVYYFKILALYTLNILKKL